MVLIMLGIHLVTMSSPEYALTGLAKDDSLSCLHSRGMQGEGENRKGEHVSFLSKA